MTIFRTRAVIGACIATLLLALVDTNIVITAAPSIARSFGGDSLGRVPWLVTAYALAETIAQPLYGKLADRYGPHLALLGSMLLFLLGSVACAAAGSMTQLVFLRIVQGLGAAGLLTVTFVLLGHIRANAEQGGDLAGNVAAGAMLALGLVAGPILGGTVVEHVSWRWVFWLNVPVTLVVITVMATCLRKSAVRTTVPIDWVAAAQLGTAAIAVQLLCLRLDSGLHSTPAWVLLLLGASGLVSLVAFMRRQTTSPTPFFPTTLLSNQTLRRITALQLTTGVGLAAATVYVAVELQVLDHRSPLDSAVQTIPMAVGVLIGAAIGALLVVRGTPLRLSFVLSNLLAGVAFGLLAWTTGDLSIHTVLIALFLLGVGVGASLGNELLIVQGAVDISLLGTATAGIRFAETVGTSVGGTACALIFAQIAFPAGTAGTAEASEHSLTLALRLVFVLGAAAMGVATVVAARLPRVLPVRATASPAMAAEAAR